MSKPEFDAAVDQLLVQFDGSLTSGRRTDFRSRVVGGFAGDPHTWGLGADVRWDDPHDGTLQAVTIAATALGLRAIHEQDAHGNPDHTHLQPLDFPAGPVTTYGGVTRILRPHG